MLTPLAVVDAKRRVESWEGIVRQGVEPGYRRIADCLREPRPGTAGQTPAAARDAAAPAIGSTRPWTRVAWTPAGCPGTPDRFAALGSVPRTTLPASVPARSLAPSGAGTAAATRSEYSRTDAP